MIFGRSIAALGVLAIGTVSAAAQEQSGGWFSGDWYLKVGGTALYAPKFDGAKRSAFAFQPIISLGKHGPSARFTSRNDAISLAVVDTGAFRAGAAGKLVMPRDEDTHADLAGLSEVRLGGEAGGFAEIYPTDFLRLRAEVRHGIRSHSGVVADVSADAFFDLTDQVQISAGPRASWASADYFDAYYGVDAAEAAASGLSEYAPGSGLKGVGAGGAVTFNVTDQLSTSVFGEYERLMGPAAESSLVRERGSRDQFSVGASAVYRFDWSW
jgi:outer membrane protein